MKSYIRQVIDTNVLISANKAAIGNPSDPNDDVFAYPELLRNCVEVLLAITLSNNESYVVLDANGEIFDEYKRYMSFSGHPGVGNSFFKWLHDNRGSFPNSERVALNKTDNGYVELPEELLELGIDKDDMKFFAVSYAHSENPVIIQATDSKWLNWVDTAMECGIEIVFLDEKYISDHQ